MAAVVATMVVGPLLKIVMGKASSYLLDKYKVLKGMEEQHEILMRKLPAILDIITDAEQAAAHREGAAAWLQAIKKVAYQANEVFDEFKYEALRREAKRKGHYKKLGFHVVKLFPTHNRFIFRNRMGRKLHKIVQAIEVLVAEMNDFGFKHQQQPLVSKQWRQTSHDIFDPKEMIRKSREKDSKKIVDTLVGQANNVDLTVVPIVGMGGLGKTTLAQLIYNEPAIQKHFNLLVWVCVSDIFDVDSLAKSIVEAAPLKKNGGTEAATASKKTPLDILQNMVSGQRYLLVLDDVWTREVDKWEELKDRLKHGGSGSVVLTTTRDEGVADIFGTIAAYNPIPLEDKFIKDIIETRAFSLFHKAEDRPDVLMNMVDEVVKRCAGSPLAAMALGSVLRTKNSKQEWEVLIKSTICTDETGILPILKLSYNDLPPRMKQCFAFCAIFPKDYKIDVYKLIQLWIAHGFIIEEKQVRLETIGEQIFNELASRSFFQDVEQVQATIYEPVAGCYSRITCKIHDLMHDVALSVMGKECVLSTEEPCKIESVVVAEEPSYSEWLPNTARHLFLSCKQPEEKLNSALEKSSPAIQTLLCDSSVEISSLQHLSKYNSLQALQLYSQGRSFPLKPKHLHHLRYLDLSRSGIRALPEDMSILYNLQTLNLSGCEYLETLPRHMKYMTALRHLYTHGCPKLKSMPRELGKLTCLQTLTCFVAGSDPDCCNVGELGKLNLAGQLELQNLENVTAKDATVANLVNKEIRYLTLRWSAGDTDVTSCRDDEDDSRVLKNLKPHDGLHAIRIHFYGSTTFPTWVAMLQNIVEIHLSDCRKLQWLFNHDCDTTFAFPKLKHLTLESLLRLERWWEIGNGGMQEEIMFPLLEMLCIRGCKKLTALPGQPTFPNLKNAIITDCPRLTTVAKSPKLSELLVEGREDQLFLWVARHMTSLARLTLYCFEDNTETTLAAAEDGFKEVVDGKEEWNGHDLPLAVLKLSKFKSVVTGMFACFVHLQDLSIVFCYALVHWPEREFQALVSLKRLEIEFCENLIGYAQAPAEPSTSSETSQLLPRLEHLRINDCDCLVEVFNISASLRTIHICCCSKLESPFGRRLQHGQLASSIHQGSSSVPEVSSSSSSSPRAGPKHLHVILYMCDGLTGVLHLPPSVKGIAIWYCNGLTSLEAHSGLLPWLESIELFGCNTLSSLPDAQAYSSLWRLVIDDCPGLKTLPASLQERLGSLESERIDAHHYGNKPRPVLLKPKTWKYAICRD